MKKIRVAVLGACGWMGKVHTSGYVNLARQFPDVDVEVEVTWLVDQNEAGLNEITRSIGCKNVSTNWEEAVVADDVDLVDICLPDKDHYPAARAALIAGKHVYCEKPLTDTFEQATELAALAKKNGLKTRLGHSFTVNPAHRLAKNIIANGDIGEITYFRGSQHVDTHGSPETPFIWRLDGDLARTGIVGDTGSHVFSIFDYLVGPVKELFAHCPIVFSERPDVPGATYGGSVEVTSDTPKTAVSNPDMGLITCKFENGAVGTIDFSRIATGKKFEQRYDIFGTKGSISYDYDQPFRLKVYTEDRAGGGVGYKVIDIGPEMHEYGAYLPLPNFSLGYNEVKMYEVREVIETVAGGPEIYPTFEDGKRIVSVTDACMDSHESNKWEKVKS